MLNMMPKIIIYMITVANGRKNKKTDIYNQQM